MVQEAPLRKDQAGLVPAGEGWFVVSAREVQWVSADGAGTWTSFEGPDLRFEQLGIALNVLAPGEPMAMYHAEETQEDFLVLAGEAVLVVEGQEHPLRAWDFVHCPPWTAHVMVGAGDGPCVVLAVGARRKGRRLRYPVDETARRHGASVEKETNDPAEAYADFPEVERVAAPPEIRG